MIKENQKFNESVNENSALLVELREKLPQFFTSDKYDENGKLIEQGAFDFAKFSREMDKENISRELSSGYTMEWTGKQLAKKQAGERSETVIVPDVKHNERPENAKSENLFFTGDNLEVLRHLQTNYQNSVDFIYIDPPYNTGSDGFVYPDKFEYSDEKLKEEFSLNDDELKRLKSIQGRATHSAWLTFMYPRLYLAKKLLKDSGVIFVSIDDNEQANLKLLMDDIFGEGGFVSEFIWQKKTGAHDAKGVATVTESILVYSKETNKKIWNKIFSQNTDAHDEARYNCSDEYETERGKYYLDTLDRGGLSYSDSMNYSITAPDGTKIFPNGRMKFENDGWIWQWSKDRLEWGIKNGFIEISRSKTKNSGWTVRYKNYLLVDHDGIPFEKSSPFQNIIQDVLNTEGTIELKNLLGNKIFTNPKPVALIEKFISYYAKDDITVLDFFAGSATTAEAIFRINSEGKGNGKRRFIMVQLPEPTFNEKNGIRTARKGS
ncbi:site-specific DNA-methyltransferase [Lactococcus lactis]|nr:site-specific DNA-methyltransferase [Lactococcus lactis]MDT2948211.1 site-specific DNA-methyltransferase [Lactococcus lactis]